MRTSDLAAVFLAALGTAGAVHRASGVVVYDGAVNSRPNQQGWVAYLPPFGGGGTQTLAAGGDTISTVGANANLGGFFSHYSYFTSVPPQRANPAWPVLHLAPGYTVRLDLQMLSETHATSDRTGFSVIAISEEGLGIEVSWWMGRVWVQEGGAAPALFTQAEGVAFDTGAAVTRYDITMKGAAYTVYADGRRILTGALRDYSAFDAGAAALPFDPYETRSFVFFGDNTRSASGATFLTRVEVLTVPVEYAAACGPADIAFDDGTPLSAGAVGMSNSGVNEGDYNAFFNGFFSAAANCDVAADDGTPLPPFGVPGNNSGVNEGDYNAFINTFFGGCAV